jgi:hypothetical protein
MMDNDMQSTSLEKSDHPTQHVGSVHHADLDVIENMMAGGIVTSAQRGSPSTWSPEKKLAGAVLASALVEIRDHAGDASYRRKLEQDLEWIRSGESEWPFSFVRLCGLFDLDADWVRGIAEAWAKGMRRPGSRPPSTYRQAA